MAALTMYLCCRCISVKMLQWHHLRVMSDAQSPTGFSLVIELHLTKTDKEDRNEFRVILYPNDKCLFLCPVFAVSILLFIFADEIHKAGDAANSWTKFEGDAVGVVDFDEADEEGPPIPVSEGPCAVVIPNFGRNYGSVNFHKVNEEGVTSLWREFCLEAGLGRINFTGHSMRRSAHTFAYLNNVSDDDLRKFAIWLNRKVAAGYNAPTFDILDKINRKLHGLPARIDGAPLEHVPYALFAAADFNLPIRNSFDRLYAFAVSSLTLALGVAPPTGVLTLADKVSYIVCNMTRKIAVQAASTVSRFSFSSPQVQAAAAAAVAATAAAAVGVGLPAAPAMGAAAAIGVSTLVVGSSFIVCEWYGLPLSPIHAFVTVAVGAVATLVMRRLLVEQLVSCVVGIAVALILPFAASMARRKCSGASLPLPPPAPQYRTKSVHASRYSNCCSRMQSARAPAMMTSTMRTPSSAAARATAAVTSVRVPHPRLLLLRLPQCSSQQCRLRARMRSQ